MEQLREWCGGICFSAVGCCIVQMMVPKDKTGRLLRLLIYTFFLCSMILPLFKITASLPLNAEFLSQEIVSEQLNDKVNEQLQRQVENVVEEIVKDCLSNRDVAAQKITVRTDIDENGSIYIDQVAVFVDKQHLAAALPARDVLKTQLETDVIIQATE